jgi:DNA-binding transcriptional LysR family regulator
MGLGVALLPRRCAVGEIARGDLVAIRVPELRAPRQVRLVARRDSGLSHAARAFLELAKRVGRDGKDGSDGERGTSE